MADIRDEVRRHYGITHPEMIGSVRSRHIARPRQLAMFLARRLTGRSFPEIGRMFGNRDHTTVLHAFTTIQALLTRDPELAAAAVAIIKRLRAEEAVFRLPQDAHVGHPPTPSNDTEAP